MQVLIVPFALLAINPDDSSLQLICMCWDFAAFTEMYFKPDGDYFLFYFFLLQRTLIVSLFFLQNALTILVSSCSFAHLPKSLDCLNNFPYLKKKCALKIIFWHF